MKVFELMNLLGDAPANMEVFIADLSNELPSVGVKHIEQDGNKQDGCFNIFIEQQEIE